MCNQQTRLFFLGGGRATHRNTSCSTVPNFNGGASRSSGDVMGRQSASSSVWQLCTLFSKICQNGSSMKVKRDRVIRHTKAARLQKAVGNGAGVTTAPALSLAAVSPFVSFFFTLISDLLSNNWIDTVLVRLLRPQPARKPL